MSALAAELDPNEVQHRVGFQIMEADLHLHDGRARNALVAAEAAWAEHEQVGIQMVAQALPLALQAAFELGDRVKLDELLGALEELPPGELVPRLRAVGARFSALRASRSGDDTTASAGFLAAADIFREMGALFDLAVVQLEHAEWLTASGRPDDAQPPLDEASEIFERLGAAPWLERLRGVERASAEPAMAD
jgi:hypothetical protein